jgi:mannitol 2-dehydrogenase
MSMRLIFPLFDTNNNMQLLSKKALSMLNTAAFQYNRKELSPGILHFSTGNFHRAHQASYYHDLFNKCDEHNEEGLMWGVRECSVRGGGSYTEETRPALEKQDYLYTIVEMDDENSDARVIGSIIDMLPFQEDHKPIKEALLEDQTKIISMTVTEGGYFLNSATNEFDPNNDAIKHDINNPDEPQTVFGLIVQALKKRRENNQDPFTVMSCDNVPGNGDAARQATVGLAKQIDKELGEWIDQNVMFPNSMVDRITPAPTDDLAKDAKVGEWDYKDDAIIFCEPFRQWVCEDKFCNNQRPALDKVGVKFVDDVTPYENMKLRILNGGHASLSYPAALLDIEYVHQAMEHETICQFVDKLQRTEIVPQVPPVPETDTEQYWNTVRGRYQNSKLSDRIDRNCEKGSDRQPKFILPTIKDCLSQQDNSDSSPSIRGLALVSAMWCRYCQGTTESGKKIDVVDNIDEIQDLAVQAKDDPQVWLDMEVYGDVGQNKAFQTAFANALETVNKKGVEAAMKQYIE